MSSTDVIIEDRVILFLDVHNFSIAANCFAGQFHTFLQEMYERLGEIITAHHGQIVKYMGDSILCVFPADNAMQAVACACTLRQTFAHMVSSHGLPGDTELETSLTSGQVVSGVFGHRSLRHWDVFGEAVNQATVIGHYRGIIVTESVYEQIKRQCETQRLPDLRVKWRDQPLQVWAVVEQPQA